MRSKSWLTLLAVLLVGGCQYLSHPFADDLPPPDSPLLTVKDSVGVSVAPVAGVPEQSGDAIAKAMAGALRDDDLPATTGAGNHHSFRLTGQVAAADSPSQLRIHWTVRSYDGKDVGSADQVIPASVAEGTEAGGSLKNLAKVEAPTLAQFMVDPTPTERKPMQQIFVRQVRGAPGDGNMALPSALTYLLKRRGVPLVSDPGRPGTITVAGTVDVTPVEGQNQDRVQIAWHVLKPDGKDVGQIAQDNTVPHGSLDGRWGEVAMAVAMAGVDDILRVAATIPPASG